MHRREFLQLLAAASAAGLQLDSREALAQGAAERFYDVPRFGKVDGYAHLATLVKRLRATRPGALLLDGGDAWQGSATALWTRGQDMVDASKLMGVDIMTGHWEFTFGMARVREVVDKDFANKI